MASPSSAGGSSRAPDEASTVIVGTAPALEDVLSGASTEPPFDLPSFTAYANRNLFAENLAFLSEVAKLRCEQDPREFESGLRYVLSEFVRANSPSQVNISDTQRKEAEQRARVVLDALAESPTSEPDRTSLDPAYKEIVRMVNRGPYARYTAHIVVQRQLRIARLDALWWTQEGLTVRRFFTFPSPINSAESRLHACLCTLLVAAALALSWFTGSHWLWVYVAYGYMARALCGPRVDPQAFLVLFVLRPLVADRLGLLHNKFTAGSPKRFAQLVGFMFATAATILAFLELRLAMLIVGACLLSASLMAGFCDFCMACEVFKMAVRANMVPQSACEDCKVRYIKGKEKSPRNKSTPRSSAAAVTPSCQLPANRSKGLYGGKGGGGTVEQDCSSTASPTGDTDTSAKSLGTENESGVMPVDKSKGGEFSMV